MSVQALYTAATGMNSMQTKLDVIANNLANTETTGFKADRPNFEDLFYRQEKYPGVVAGQEVLPGHAARVLVGLSARADLVVLGRRAVHARHAGLPGPGAVRNAVLSHAHGPVVIVPSS